MLTPASLNVFQSAWVVDDLDKTIHDWADRLGVGPFYCAEYDNPFPNLIYRGEPGEMNARVAWAQAGDTQVELIQPNDERNVYRELVPSGTTRFHHFGVWTADYEADCSAMEAAGYELALALPRRRDPFCLLRRQPNSGMYDRTRRARDARICLCQSGGDRPRLGRKRTDPQPQ